MTKGIFIGSTGQNVGKTTTCLGLVSGLRKKFQSVGFIKPVGQEHIKTPCGHFVDKDVSLFKNQFHINDPIEMMSPVLFPKGFTRNCLNGKVDLNDLREKIQNSYNTISESHEAVVVEGTGHIGVGSIADLNNAIVAKQLGLKIIIIASGGLGSSFDAFMLNKLMCDHHGVEIAGVILNRVYDDKREMVLEYMQKALDRFNIPIVGCIPYDNFLSNPSMKDFESLLNTPLLSGHKHKMRHFEQTRLIATSVDVYHKLIFPSQLIITPASREDIINATLAKHWDVKSHDPEDDLKAGMILTGSIPPKPEHIEAIVKADIPMIYAPVNSFMCMKMITSHIVKIRKEDHEKISEAIKVVESHIDFDAICNILN